MLANMPALSQKELKKGRNNPALLVDVDPEEAAVLRAELAVQRAQERLAKAQQKRAMPKTTKVSMTAEEKQSWEAFKRGGGA